MENPDALQQAPDVPSPAQADSPVQEVPRDVGSGTATPEAGLPDQPADSAGSEGVRPAEPAKIKFTSKIKRGLALMRMVNLGALSDDAPPPTRIMAKMSKKQQDEYNSAMAWIEQEEDWDAVSKVWQEAGGQ